VYSHNDARNDNTVSHAVHTVPGTVPYSTVRYLTGTLYSVRRKVESLYSTVQYDYCTYCIYVDLTCGYEPLIVTHKRRTTTCKCVVHLYPW
jgi:hypothetical protein